MAATQDFMACIDVGGTFTDLYLVDPDGKTTSFKASTTPDDPTQGFFDVLEKAADSYDVSVSHLLSNMEMLKHGTTTSTNAIVEGETERTGLICTEGFRDTLWLREGAKGNPYKWEEYPDPYVPRKLTFGVEERIDADGQVVTELNEEQVRETIDQLEDYGVDSVGVALLWAHQNPAHEKRIGELIEQEAPDMHYSLSHQVNPIIREYPRTSSTVIDASLSNTMKTYFANLREGLAERDASAKVLILASNGGALPVDEAEERPIWTVDSGPTLFPVCVKQLVSDDLGKENVVAIDMGGTSLDVSVVKENQIPRTRQATVGDNYKLGIDKVDVRSTGSGGGSIAWIDEGGLLHVGPKSAGAEPGPICYLRGGEEPTVTDAAISLGYLNEDYFLGGEMDVSRQAAIDGIEATLSEELGTDPLDAAYSIYATVTQNIVQGIRDMTVERGIDPRNYVLSGGGGTMGTFAVPVARELKMDEVYLPKDAGVVSSVGGVLTDIKQDFSASHATTASDFDFEAVNDLLETLEADAESFLDAADIPEEDRSMTFYSEARYSNQIWELEIEIPSRISEDAVSVLEDRFHRAHEDVHGYRTDDEIEFLYWRLEADGRTPKPDLRAQADTTSTDVSDANVGTRLAYFDGSMVSADVYRSSGLAPGHSFVGPAIVEDPNTTFVIPPDAEFTVTEFGNYHVKP